MLSVSLFYSRRNVARALTISVATGLAALSINACEGDSPMTPQSSLRSEQASAERGGQLIRQGNGILTWTLKDGVTNTLLGGGQFQLTGPNNFSLTVKDNLTPADQDPIDGAFKVMGLLPGTYTLCETVPPPKFLLPPVAYVSACTDVSIVPNGTNSGTQYFNEHIPRVTWSVVDPVGNPLGGSYFVLTDSLKVQTPVLDDSPQDLDKTFGYFLKELTVPGNYVLCEVLAPSGFVLPVSACRGNYAPWGLPNDWGKWVNAPNYSLVFNVTDTFGKPLGGTSFAVKRVGYPNSSNINVSDNITPDRDPVTGKYFVIVPAAGDYIVCQHDAPYGFDPPKANAGCYPYVANVKFGVPKNVGTFVDTPWPVAR